MKSARICALLAIIIITGCSSIKVIPEQVPSGIINLKENSQTIVKDSIKVTVAPADPDMINYSIQGLVASFDVIIHNGSAAEVSFDNNSFLLMDAEKRQYYPLTPEKIKEMLAKDTYYLLPYPYVGFYYLEDYERAQFKNSTSSNLPYYFELNPQDVHLKALPTESVIPEASIKGLIYFNADISSMNSFTVNVYRKGASKSSPPDFVFPFKVVK